MINRLLHNSLPHGRGCVATVARPGGQKCLSYLTIFYPTKHVENIDMLAVAFSSTQTVIPLSNQHQSVQLAVGRWRPRSPELVQTMINNPSRVVQRFAATVKMTTVTRSRGLWKRGRNVSPKLNVRAQGATPQVEF